MSREQRVLDDQWEAERAREFSQAQHPGDWETTAGPPEPTVGETVQEAAGDAVYHSFFTLGTR
jgi:hypothetical protein